MIDPEKITRFNRTPDELFEFWLFCILAAGRNESRVSVMLDRFLEPRRGEVLRFVRRLASKGTLRARLEAVGTGQYKKVESAIIDTLGALRKDSRFLSRANVQELEAMRGIGPRTARYFVLHSRKAQRVAILGRHTLKWMASLGYSVPDTAPSPSSYHVIEAEFLRMAEESGITPFNAARCLAAHAAGNMSGDEAALVSRLAAAARPGNLNY